MALTRKRRSTMPDPTIERYRHLCGLWFARLLEHVRPGHDQARRVACDDDSMFLLGLSEARQLVSECDEDSSPVQGRGHLQQHLKTVLRAAKTHPPSLKGTPLADNLALLGAKLGLSSLEQEIAAIAVLLNGYRPFSGAVGTLNLSAPTPMACRIIEAMAGSDVQAVHTALQREAPLAQSGLVRLDGEIVDFEFKLLLPDGFANIMLSTHATEAQLLAHFFRAASPAQLTQGDYPHLAADLELLRQYLAESVAGAKRGVNILLYGEPGVGKTELAKLLAGMVGATLYEVSHADADGESIRGEGRLNSYLLCQRILARGGDSLILFDEIEDVFPNDFSGFLALLGAKRGNASASKAWINRTLESNPVPAIWISNDVGQIDPAYLRRFDYALEIPRPPRPVRERIAAKHLQDAGIGADWISRIAGWSALTPAQLEKAARVTKTISPQHPAEAQAIAERVLRSSARLLEQPEPPKHELAAGYRLDYLNVSLDVGALIEGLKRRPRASFCFYGAPGTGKTALARHIAEAIGRPLMIRRASDLLDKYVGESEKAIARMFRDAAQEGAVLVLDEADGLLADRRGALRSWEITQVNEMLADMEDFEGIFICTTNLLERMDAASLRRFAFKLRFDCLQAQQRKAFFLAFWQRLNPAADQLDELTAKRLDRLDTLTPGDFAAVARQWAILDGAPSAAQLVDALEAECAVKEHQTRPIGFTA